MKKAVEKLSYSMDVAPEKAWKVIGQVGGVDKWFSSVISSCKVEGDRRYCETVDGVELIEHILEVNHQTKTLRFSIPQQELLPAQNIVETMQVRSNGNGGSIVDWWATFEANDENAPIAKQALRDLWNSGLIEMENYINNDLP